MTVTSARRRPVRDGSQPDVRALVAFFALAYVLSWSWAIPLAVDHLIVRRGTGWPTHLPALLGPAIAAVIVVAWTTGRPGLRDIGTRMVRWRVPARWWLVALSPVVFLGLALIAMIAFGRPLPQAGDFARFSGTPAIGLAGVLVVIFAGALGEETGWRGYALPQLQRRLSPLASTAILAVLWFGWHIPQFWVIATYREFAPVQYVGMFLGLACGAVVLTWLYNRSGGSILLVAVWHALYNLVGATQAATGLLAAVVSTLIMIQGVVLIVLEVRARRRGRPSVLGPPDPAPHRPLTGSS